MTDLITYVIGQLRGACWEEEAAAVEALVQERDEALAKLDKVVEAYAEEVEARNKELTLQLLATSGQAADALDKLATCEKYRDAYAECDKIGTQTVRGLEAKLAMAVEALRWYADFSNYLSNRGDYAFIDLDKGSKAEDTLAELEKTE